MRLEGLAGESSTPPMSSGIDDCWVGRAYCSCRSGGASGLGRLRLIAFRLLAWTLIAGQEIEMEYALQVSSWSQICAGETCSVAEEVSGHKIVL